MIQNVFIDSDIILDAGLARAPFFKNSKMVLVMMEKTRTRFHLVNMYRQHPLFSAKSRRRR